MFQFIRAFSFVVSSIIKILFVLDYFSSLEVFTRYHPSPFSKMLTFYRKDPFVLSASYSNPEDIPYPSTDIGELTTFNM